MDGWILTGSHLLEVLGAQFYWIIWDESEFVTPNEVDSEFGHLLIKLLLNSNLHELFFILFF